MNIVVAWTLNFIRQLNKKAVMTQCAVKTKHCGRTDNNHIQPNICPFFNNHLAHLKCSTVPVNLPFLFSIQLKVNLPCQ